MHRHNAMDRPRCQWQAALAALCLLACCAGAFLATPGQSYAARTDLARVEKVTVKRKTISLIKIRWTEVEGARGYKVSMAGPGKKKFKEAAVVEGRKKLTCTVHGLKQGKKYRFKVCAYRSGPDGEEYGKYSPAIAVRTVSLPAPRINRTHADDGYVVMAWKRVEGAGSYQIQRSDSPNSGWKNVGTKPRNYKLPFTDRAAVAGVNHYYRVRARKGSSTSEWSKPVVLQPRLAIPNILALTPSVIKWSAAKGAVEYEVLKRDAGSDKWVSVGITTKRRLSIDDVEADESTCFTVIAHGKHASSRLVDAGFSRRDMRYGDVRTLIEGDSVLSPPYSFGERAMRLLGIDYDSRALPGSRVSSSVNDRRNAYRRSMRMGFEGYNLIVFRMGSCDYNHSIEVGKLGNSNVRTFAGAFEAILKRMRKDAPDATIVLCTPLDRAKIVKGKLVKAYSHRNNRGYTMNDYRKVILELGDKYGCYVYDMRNSDVVNTANVFATTFDCSHPNYAAQIRLGDEFADYLKQVL